MKLSAKTNLYSAAGMLALISLTAASAMAGDHHDGQRQLLVITSTNSASGNEAFAFKLNMTGTPALSLVNRLHTGGTGGAGGNGGSVQFQNNFGAVVNYGSNNITQLNRNDDLITIGNTINLAPGCTKPVSVALTKSHLFAVGANCIESHSWPSGTAEGAAIATADASAGQIAVGRSWAAVTMKSGSVLQLPLTAGGALAGTKVAVTLPANANDTPLGAAFWGDILGFNPAHSPDSFALVDKNRNVFPVLGPQPVFPANAPCWLAKGPGNIWYSGNTPGYAISIFFSDGQGGSFYKSVPLPGSPTDLTVSGDGKWLAVIYTAADSSGGRVAIYAIDTNGDLSLTATSSPAGIASFNGVAISE
jgi:hypothetical protein